MIWLLYAYLHSSTVTTESCALQQNSRLDSSVDRNYSFHLMISSVNVIKFKIVKETKNDKGLTLDGGVLFELLL